MTTESRNSPALLSDASTRAVKQTIAAPIWWALRTRSGGEVKSSGAYCASDANMRLHR